MAQNHRIYVNNTYLFKMSLLQTLSYDEYKKYKSLSQEQCEFVAKLAKLKLSFTEVENSGEYLLRVLDRSGYSKSQFYQLMKALLHFQPQAKVVILIANDKYVHLSKLATPSVDCDSLATYFKELGFIVVTVKNSTGTDLKDIIRKICGVLPSNSYCFVFYAGHGCQLCNTKCILGIDCPIQNISIEHCVTENYLLKHLGQCQLDLCVLIMDMCRVYLERDVNPQIYSSMTEVEDYIVHKNLLVAYSTQSSQSAYEVLQIQCSETIDCDVTYELKTGDTARIIPAASQYVNALCARIKERCDINTLLDKVHADVENSLKKQRPIKIQCGVDKRYLYDIIVGDMELLKNEIKEAITDYKTNCEIF